MNSTQVHCFLAAARCKSFTVAADEVFLSQQAISKYVINLEAELGVCLFHRQRGELTLTEAGTQYYRLFSDWARRIEDVRKTCEKNSLLSSHILHVGISSWLDPLGEIAGGIGHCQLCTDSEIITSCHTNSRLFTALEEDAVDMILLPEDQVDANPAFSHAVLAPDRMCIYAPADIGGDIIDKHCWNLPFLAVPARDWSQTEWSRISRQDLSGLGVVPQRIITVHDTLSMNAMFRLGRYTALADDRFGPLSSIPDARRFPIDAPSGLTCVWKTRSENTLIQPFVSSMQKYFEKEKI